MTDDRYKISRRKALGGLATIGVAGAGAGLGTSALFSDEEEFSDNTFTAGTLDMSVTAEIVAANQYWEDNPPIETFEATADGEVVTGLQVEDVKPGDWAIICFNVDVVDNPGYVTIHAKNLEEREGASTEPERSTGDDTTDHGWQDVTETNAELGDKLLVEYWERYDDSGDRSGLSYLDNPTNTESNQLWQDSWQDPNEDGYVSDELGYTDVREFFYGEDQVPANDANGNDPLGNGFGSGDGVLVGGVSNPTIVGSNATAYNQSGQRRTNEDGELVFYLCLELPEEVGNEIQGDAVRGDLVFNTVQVRNNDNGRSGSFNNTA